MAAEHSDTYWLDRLKVGDRQAADVLWSRYSERLQALVRRKLGDAPRRERDEEDVVLSAFNSFYLKAERGGFPELKNGVNLWSLLFTITIRKAINQFHRATRYENLVAGESAVPGPANSSLGIPGLEHVPDERIVTDLAAVRRHLLECLPGDGNDPGSLWAVAEMHLEGLSSEEIGRRLDLCARTIQRKLKLIYAIWERELREREGGR